MITSQKNEPWPLDVTIKHKNESGLTAPSIVRMKLFTLDNRLILKKVGHLSKADQEQVKQSLSTTFDYPLTDIFFKIQLQTFAYKLQNEIN